MKLYHYTNKPFDEINIDKCDGFWMTDISPENEEMLNEIGASALEYVAICELEEGEELIGGKNYDVEDQLNGTEFDYMRNIYDGFEDYAVVDTTKVKIIEWVKL